MHNIGLDLYIADCPPKENHAETNHKEIEGLKLYISTNSMTTDILTCMTIPDIQEARESDIHLQALKNTSF